MDYQKFLVMNKRILMAALFLLCSYRAYNQVEYAYRVGVNSYWYYHGSCGCGVERINEIYYGYCNDDRSGSPRHNYISGYDVSTTESSWVYKTFVVSEDDAWRNLQWYDENDGNWHTQPIYYADLFSNHGGTYAPYPDPIYNDPDVGLCCTNRTKLFASIEAYDPVKITNVRCQNQNPDGSYSVESGSMQCVKDGANLIFDLDVQNANGPKTVYIQAINISDGTIINTRYIGAYASQVTVNASSFISNNYGRNIVFRTRTYVGNSCYIRGELSSSVYFVPAFPNPSVYPEPPTCNGFHDAGLDIYFNTSNYNNYVFSISKLIPKTGGSCSNTYGAGGVGDPIDPGYCFTGEGASIICSSADIASGHIIIDNSKLYNGTKDNGSGLTGQFGAGFYELSAEAVDTGSCVFKKIIGINETPELVLRAATPENSYVWNGETFNINGYGGADAIAISLTGGTHPYRYWVGNNLVFYGNDTSFLYPGVIAGHYVVSIADAYNCPVTNNNQTVDMKQPDPISIVAVAHDTISCHADNSGTHDDGSIQLQIHGGIGPYNVTTNPSVNSVFSNLDNNMNLTGFSALPYSLTIRDKYISQKDFPVTLTSRPRLGLNPIAELDKTWPPCIEGEGGTVKVSGYGGSPYESHGRYKFVVESITDTVKADTAVLENLKAITYNILIRDKRGCGDTTNNVKIPQNPRPLQLVLVDTIPPVCYNYNDGKADFTHRNGVSLNADTSIHQFNYVLNNLPGTLEYSQSHLACDTGKFDQIRRGWYRIEISDSDDCTINYAYSDTIFLSQPDPIGIKTMVHYASMKGAKDGRLKATFSGGNKKYKFEWYKIISAAADSFIASGITIDTTSISGLVRGDYLLRVQDTCGCSNGQGETNAWLEWVCTIREPEQALGFTLLERKNASCSGLSDGRIVIDGIGGWGNMYRYGLNPDQLSYDRVFGNLPAGLYTVYVEDEQNGVFQDTIRILEPAPLKASVSSTTSVTCYGNTDGGFSIDISGGTAPYYISMDDNAYKQEEKSMLNLGAGVYNVEVSDSNSCPVKVQVTIIQPDSLSISLGNLTNTRCRETSGSISVICAGGIPSYSYQWTNNDNQVIGTLAAIDSLKAGTYSLIATDQNGCNKTSPWYTILNSDGPLLTDTLIVPVSCKGKSDGTARITVTNGIPGYTYQWSNGKSSDNITGLITGIYFVTFTDQAGCSNQATLYIPTPDSLIINALSLNDPQCFGYTNGSIVVTSQGGTMPYKYSWTNGRTEDSISGLKTGSYSVTATDAHQCLAVNSFSLNDPDPVYLNLGREATMCGGQSITLDAGEFNVYNWSSDKGFTSGERIVKLSNSGNYYLEVLDSRGCVGKDTFKLVTSNSLLHSDFLIKSEALTGDTVVAINISWPVPDSTHWVYDRSLIRGTSDGNYENLIFNTPGTYLISLYANLGDCKDNFTHSITINPRDQFNELRLGAEQPLIKSFIVHPNPNKGDFSAEVELREDNDIVLQLFNYSNLIDQKHIKGTNKYLIDYNVSYLPAGVYILQLMAGNERQQIKIIVY
jgi:hypothetical protein